MMSRDSQISQGSLSRRIGRINSLHASAIQFPICCHHWAITMYLSLYVTTNCYHNPLDLFRIGMR